MTGYELTRRFFDFCFENPEKISPNHIAIYSFAIEHCNRLGWKNKFGFPTQMAMDAIGIKKHQTYIRYFNDLVDWGFFDLIEKSQNQYSSNIISLISAMPKNGKALDKAIITHTAKQTETIGQSTGQSNSSINKPITINQETINKESIGETSSPTLTPSSKKKSKEVDMSKYTKEQIESFERFEKWIDSEAYNIRKIKEQINIEHFFNLFKKYRKDLILDTILALHNKPEYCNGKKAFSVNLTVQNWIKRAITNNHNTKNQNDEYIPKISKSEYEAKYGNRTQGSDDPEA